MRTSSRVSRVVSPNNARLASARPRAGKRPCRSSRSSTPRHSPRVHREYTRLACPESAAPNTLVTITEPGSDPYRLRTALASRRNLMAVHPGPPDNRPRSRPPGQDPIVGALVRGADVEGDREIVEGIVLGDRLHLFGSLGQEDPMPEGELREGRDDLPLGPLPGGSLLEDFLSLLKLPFLGRGQADRCHLHTRIH